MKYELIEISVLYSFCCAPGVRSPALTIRGVGVNSVHLIKSAEAVKRKLSYSPLDH